MDLEQCKLNANSFYVRNQFLTAVLWTIISEHWITQVDAVFLVYTALSTYSCD